MTVAPADMNYIVCTKPHNPPNLSWPGGCESRGAFHTNICAKVGVNPPLLALGSMTTKPTLQWWMGMVWNSKGASTSRHKHRGRDSLAPWLGFPDWVISAGRGSRAITLGPPLGPQFGFSTYEVKSLGHFPQHHLHLGRMNINKTWGMAELRKESGNI